MRKLLFILGLVVFAGVTFLVSVAVLSRVAHAFGVPCVTIVSVLSLGAAAWAGRHTPESRAVADDVITALGKLGIQRQQAADRMGISDDQLARQLAGLEMLSAYRLAQIGPDFREEFHRLSVEREGRGKYLADGLLLDILHHVRLHLGQHVVTTVGNRAEAA